MSSMNKVIVMGRLGQDPEVKYTPSQKAVCTLNIATSEYAKDESGNRSDKTEWHKVVVWDKQAENCGTYLTKGSMVLIEGKLQTRSWDDKDGQKKYATEIVARDVRFINTQSSGGQSDTPKAAKQYGTHNNNTTNDSVSFSVDDDIPF